MITVLTDNNNRASADVKTVMNKQKLKPAESVAFVCSLLSLWLFPHFFQETFVLMYTRSRDEFSWKMHLLKNIKSAAPLVFWACRLSHVSCHVCCFVVLVSYRIV